MAVREFNAPQRHAAKIARITHKRHVSVWGPQHVHPQTPRNCGPLGPLAQRTRNPKFLENVWCGREDSNFHGLSATATSTLRVYQFRHDRT
jgi:hypothetical protein